MEGRSTLQNRKDFISNLQNSVELFMKQIMLNKKDYRVSEVKKINSDGEPASSYYNSQDLNVYFKNTPDDVMKLFYSIEFNKLCEIHKEVLAGYLSEGQCFTSELKLLRKLRNMETHFYIGPDDFLTESEFVTLHNFMIDFYGVLILSGLIPSKTIEYQHLEFNNSKLTAFSYVDAVKNIELVKKIALAASKTIMLSFPGETAYDMAASICCSNKSLLDHFNEVWDYMEILDYLNLIEIHEIVSERPSLYFDDCHSPEINYCIEIKI